MFDNSFWGTGNIGGWNFSIGNAPYPPVVSYPAPVYGGGGIYGGIYGGTVPGSGIDGTLVLLLIVLGVFLIVK